MSRLRSVAEFFRQEDGSFTSTAIVLTILIAIMAIAIIDGSSVYYAYRAANDVTAEAADDASSEFQLYRNEIRAQDAAIEHCEEKDLTFIEVSRDLELSRNAFTVTCEKDAPTYVFKHLPFLKDLTRQQVSSTSYSSY